MAPTTQIHQLLAKEPTVKAAAQRTLTTAHHNLAKPQLLTGVSRTYTPRDEEGEQLPPESVRVQLAVPTVLVDVRTALGDLFDLAFTKDAANQQARADIIIGDNTLVADVPVSTLLTLEKELRDLATFVSKLPVLDPAEVWHWDENQGWYATAPVTTVRTRKVPRNHVKAEATQHHPAQVEVYYEDVPVGYWQTVKFCGALPQVQVAAMAARVRALQQAVAEARQRANSTEAHGRRIGETVLGFVFG